MIKIPYGISNFETLVTKGLYYVDRTKYIETLEHFFSSYLVFVRPRRFGKSLFISTLEYYYGLQHKDKFQQLFGNYYIGQHPTLSANQYLILKFDFSQINTASFEATYDAFLENIKDGGLNFLSAYPQFFDKDDLQEIKDCTTPVQVMQSLLRQARFKAAAHKIYLLIDEYDHFANEILSFRFKEFTKIVGQNGFVRKFYEAIKVGTHSGVIDQIFITGVSPLTLDSLTSGFNIATNISLDDAFNGMMGFKEKEVLAILKGIEVPTIDLPQTVALMKKWYDGYLFSKTATERLYNSDMVLYFAASYAQKKQFPEILLDPNIASDYTKVRRLFKVKDQEAAHLTYLEDLLKNREITSSLVQLFEIDKRFDRKDFISLLYYTGILTIKGSDWANVVFKMPNYVIEQLYYQYFYQIILERSQLEANPIDLNGLVKSLALDNDLQPLLNYTQSILTELSNRDKMKFDERYIKLIFTSVFFTNGIYTIHNELEVKKSLTSKGYVDLFLAKRPPYKPSYQFVIELKYIKKSEADTLASVKKKAVKQLKGYLKYDTYLQGIVGLRAYVVVFVGNEGHFVEV